MNYKRARSILDDTDKRNFTFNLLVKICDTCFGECRKKGSHIIYKTPWSGDPRVNIQPDKGDPSKAKPYQVENVRKAVDRWFREQQGGDENGGY